MSVRSERTTADASAAVAALNISSTATDSPAAPNAVQESVVATIAAADAANPVLGEGNTLSTNNPDHPLTRTFVANVRATLNDLCVRKSKATWSPSPEVVKSILQQKRFTDLSGTQEQMGDLNSVVLHSMKLNSYKSDFPVPLGVKLTGVDANTFSQTGEAFATIVPDASTSNVARDLQCDDVQLAYEFARKFPGYTASNLETNGVHEVAARRFCLVAANHPLVAAISENAERLQLGEISMMPEGLVKIGSDLYHTMLPLVKSQVAAQIKVRDMTNAKVTISPSEATSWSDVRTSLLAEKKALLRANLEAELASTTDAASIEALRTNFGRREREIENEVDNTPFSFSASFTATYNFLAQ